MRQIVEGPKVTWIDIQNPTKKDIQYLKENFNFHPLVLGELIPPGHRPKVEHHNDYLFMILYYPVYSREKKGTKPGELDIIITKDTVITSHYQSFLPPAALFDSCKLFEESRKKYMSEGTGHLLFHILSTFWKSCLIKLEQLDGRIDEIERGILRGKEKEMVLEISRVKTDVIDFWRIIEPQKEILESSASEGTIFFGKSLSPYFSDILGTYGKALHSITASKETILALEDTNQSLLSTKTNETIRTLTVFSVILLPLTLLASIWGMNVALPFGSHPIGFWIIVAMMLSLMGGMFFYFHKKGWL